MYKDNRFFKLLKEQQIKCGYGWYGLIAGILKYLTNYNNNHPNEQLEIESFEEKQGILQIKILEGDVSPLSSIIDKAIESSKCICEICGCIGEITKSKKGKDKTLCKECLIEFNKKGMPIKNDDSLYFILKKIEFYCGYGWLGMIIPSLLKLEEYSLKLPDFLYEITAIEEKWGKIGYSTVFSSDTFNNLIPNKTDKTSVIICEHCGCIGGERGSFGGKYLITLCPDCSKAEREYHKKEIEKRAKYIQENMSNFLLELSFLTKKYKLLINGCGCCGSPQIYDLEYLELEYDDLKYNEKTGIYSVDGFRNEDDFYPNF